VRHPLRCSPLDRRIHCSLDFLSFFLLAWMMYVVSCELCV
jgi:hypothetical protein